MRPPRIHPMLATIVSAALFAIEGTRFTERAACPACSGALKGYDTKKKRFAVVRAGEKSRPLYVYVRRFYCERCHALVYADEPFYPGTRIGSPVVDLGITIAATVPPNRVAAYLAALGITVDRTTFRLYAKREFPAVPTTDVFGIKMPLSVFTLSTLATRTGEGGRIEGAEILAACGFPSANRATLDHPVPGKEGNERDKQEQEKERQVHRPQDKRDADRDRKEGKADVPGLHPVDLLSRNATSRTE